MCVKLPPENLNPNSYPPHPTSIYTCGVTIALRVCGGDVVLLNIMWIMWWIRSNNLLMQNALFMGGWIMATSKSGFFQKSNQNFFFGAI